MISLATCVYSVGFTPLSGVSANTIKMTMASERSAPPDNSKKLFIAARRVAGRNKCVDERRRTSSLYCRRGRRRQRTRNERRTGRCVHPFASLARPSGLHSMHANEAGDRASRQARRHDCRIREFRGRQAQRSVNNATTYIDQLDDDQQLFCVVMPQPIRRISIHIVCSRRSCLNN